MPSLLKLRQAARPYGVSPGRLYRAIAGGRWGEAPGGGPGKPSLVSPATLQTFCRSEGLHVPEAAELSERAERAEHAARPTLSPPDARAVVLTGLRAMRARDLSLQPIANEFSAEGMLTLSSRGHWQRRKVGNLLAPAGGERANIANASLTPMGSDANSPEANHLLGTWY